ncbi:MAG: hypothetical protein VX677_10495 [Candidatus Poribacteria bacterium]|nr:hypothetical protein [Candidatus Poribacteria bacterium]
MTISKTDAAGELDFVGLIGRRPVVNTVGKTIISPGLVDNGTSPSTSKPP